MSRLRFPALMMLSLFGLLLAGCQTTPLHQGGAGEPTSNHTPFTVTSVDLSVNPASIEGAYCGVRADFTYAATFHVPAHSSGGVIAFTYTLNNGRSQIPSAVTLRAGETSKTFTFMSSGNLPSDHTYPGGAIIDVTSPNALTSATAIPAGACAEPGAFQVSSVSLTVSPASIADLKCWTTLTVTYTATFALPTNGPGGVVRFEYTTNNGRGSNQATLTVAPGQTSASYSFDWTGPLPPDHTRPAPGGVIVTSPNAIASTRIAPSGSCN